MSTRLAELFGRLKATTVPDRTDSVGAGVKVR